MQSNLGETCQTGSTPTVVGSDGYYGTYGGGGAYPTSYNPWGTGSPSASTYTGTGNATPNAGSVTDQYNGRVTNNTVLTVTNKAGDHKIASGTAAELLSNAAAIISSAAYDNRYYVDSYRAPVIYIPGLSGGKVDFANSQAFMSYLNRSTSWLIPEAAVAAAFQSTLGRAADSGNIVNLENLINAGGSLGSVQWALAHTPEAAAKIGGLFGDVLGRVPDQATVADWQNRLSTTSLADVKTYLAHTDEAVARINDVYVQTLGRGLDGASVAGRESQLANSSLGTVRWDIAHTAEATARINDVYVQTLGRGLDGASVEGRQDQLGTSSLGAVRWDIAHTAEATARINDVYVQTLGRGLDGAGVGGRQDQLGTSSLGAVRWDVAHSAEAADRLNEITLQLLERRIDAASLQGVEDWLASTPLSTMRLSISQAPEVTSRINGIYQLLLGRTPDAAGVANLEVNYLAPGGSMDGIRQAVANSPEARIDFDADYYLQHNPDVAAAGVNPYLHYATYGWREGRNPDAYFNTNYYLQHNPDVAAAGVNPLLHYRIYGWREGRDPSQDFSVGGYLSVYRDVAAAGVDPLLHYLSSGINEGRLTFAPDSIYNADGSTILVSTQSIEPGIVVTPQAAYTNDVLSRLSRQVTAAVMADVRARGEILTPTQAGTMLHKAYQSAAQQMISSGLISVKLGLETGFYFGTPVDGNEVGTIRTDVILYAEDGITVAAVFDYKTSMFGTPANVTPSRARALQDAVARPGQDPRSIPIITIPVTIVVVPR